MAGAEVWKAAVVAVGGDPLTAGFDDQSRQVGVADEVPFGGNLFTQTAKDIPVVGTWHHGYAVWLPRDNGR